MTGGAIKDIKAQLAAGKAPAAVVAPRRLPSLLAKRQRRLAFMQPLLSTKLYTGSLPKSLRGSVSHVQERIPIFIDSWPGDATHGEAFLAKRISFFGKSLTEPQPFWHPEEGGAAWLREWHSFCWLRDIRAANHIQARTRGREWILDWIATHQRVRGIPFEVETLARRINHWLLQHDFLAVAAEPAFLEAFYLSLYRQSVHLARILPYAAEGSTLILALKTLVMAGLAFAGSNWRAKGERLLAEEIARQFDGDGFHIERSPWRSMLLLYHLSALRRAYTAANQRPPEYLQKRVERMTMALHTLVHPDGGLALFNGSDEGPRPVIGELLRRLQMRRLSNRRREASAESHFGGFERMQAGETVVIVDAGLPPPRGYDRYAHAGALSFEMSVQGERLIVNCGSSAGASEWQAVQRSTAAHSTLTVADTNAALLLDEGGMAAAPLAVSCERTEEDGQIWLTLWHDGYQDLYEIIHKRRLFLSADGMDFRGEDSVVGTGGYSFAIRFHLHPEVKPALYRDRQGATLSLPSGQSWRFRVQGGTLAVEDSVYLGVVGTMQQSQQLVVQGDSRKTSVIQWSLTADASPREGAAIE